MALVLGDQRKKSVHGQLFTNQEDLAELGQPELGCVEVPFDCDFPHGVHKHVVTRRRRPERVNYLQA